MGGLFFGERRRSLDWGDVFGVAGSDNVNFMRGRTAALSVVAVWAAVSLKADMFSVLPMSCYQGGSDSSKKIKTPAFLALPDSSISVLDWRYQLSVSLDLRGNAYGLITGTPGPAGIKWIHPDIVHVDESGTIPSYRIEGHSKPETLYAHGGRILHIREFIQPGTVVGLSPIAQFRNVWETANGAIDFGRNWFKNSAKPSGILKAEKVLKTGQAAEAKTLFMQATRNNEPVTLDSNWSWESLSIKPDEAQFLQTIKATASQIAAIFRVSPDDIGGESGSSRTYSNREMDQEVFNVRTLLPRTMRVELALSALLPGDPFVKFNMDVLNRPSLMDRSKAYSENLKNGSITLSEVRDNEDRPQLTPLEIEEWQTWYATFKSESESTSSSTSSASVTK